MQFLFNHHQRFIWGKVHGPLAATHVINTTNPSRMFHNFRAFVRIPVRPTGFQTHTNCLSKVYLSVRLFLFFNNCRRLPENKRHSSLFFHCSDPKFLVVMAVCTPSIHILLGRPLFLLSRGIQSIINFGILSSGILLTWPFHCSLFRSMITII